MKRLFGILALLIMLAGAFLLPVDGNVKARFGQPPEPSVAQAHKWIQYLPQRLINDGNDCITVGGDDMATTGWLRRSNGQSVSVDLRGKTLMGTPRIRFRGVGTSTTTIEYKNSSPNSATFLKSGGAMTSSSVAIPAVPSGYEFDRITGSVSIGASVSGSWYAWLSLPMYVDEKSGSGTNGVLTGITYANQSGSMLFEATHSQTHDITATVITRGKKTTTVTTKSEDPSCAGATSGDLANGVTSSWYNITLSSDNLNTFIVSVGGSGQVDVEIEYEVKASQPAPSAPSVGSLTPTAVVLTSDAGSLIVCNGQTKASGSTWSGLSEKSGYSAYAYMPETSTQERSPNSGSTSFTTPASTGPPSIQTRAAEGVDFTAATIGGNVTSANGDTPTRYLRWGYSADEMDFIIPLGTGTGIYSIELSGLEPGLTYYFQAYATNIYGTGNGAVLSFSTPYPTLDAPIPESPENGSRLQDRRPWLTFTLPVHEHNPAETYQARARVSEYSSMSPAAVTLDSATVLGEWQYWDGTAWLAWPVEIGVTPGTKVRCRPELELPYRTFYWDCTADDGQVWGASSNPWTFRVLIAVTRTFSLVIADKETVGVKNTVASETCNGELGEISFELFNKDDQADAVNDNDLVILGINDKLNNIDEFRALVREKKPVAGKAGKMVKITCVTGDGILADRIVKQDYPAQEVGLSLKHAVDTYCAPLTSENINTSTGIVAALAAKDGTVLQLFEQVRRDYNLFFHVDNAWDVHLYAEGDIAPAIVQIQYGANGVTLMGVT